MTWGKPDIYLTKKHHMETCVEQLCAASLNDENSVLMLFVDKTSMMLGPSFIVDRIKNCLNSKQMQSEAKFHFGEHVQS